MEPSSTNPNSNMIYSQSQRSEVRLEFWVVRSTLYHKLARNLQTLGEITPPYVS